MKSFELYQPSTYEEAISLLRQYGKKAKVMAGGTDLLVRMKGGEIVPEYIVNLKNIRGLNHVTWRNNILSIGAGTTIHEIERSSTIQGEFNLLIQAAHKLGGYQTRNLATIGGNLCNASPSAEMAPALIVLGSKLKIMGANGNRNVPIEDFFSRPSQTILQDDEILAEIQIPRRETDSRGTYLKLGVRNAMEIAIVSVAVLLALDSKQRTFKYLRIALGGVAPTPIRVMGVEEIAKGREPNKDLIRELCQIGAEEAKPISDLRATAEYRKEMVQVLVRRAVMQTLKESAYDLEREEFN
jgi:CO/xanthine dehydrogenase FAD-binding subunit